MPTSIPDLSTFRNIPYVRGGRTIGGADCYGFALIVREQAYGRRPLPPYSDTMPGDLRRITRDIDTLPLSKTTAVPGALAAAYCGSLCAHFAVVVKSDNRVMIFEIDDGIAPRLVSVRNFESRYTRVVYYD